MEKSVSAQMKPVATSRPALDEGLRRARGVVVAAILLPALLLALIFLDGAVRAVRQDRTAREWMRILDLSVPAFRPSGTPQRYPAALPPGFDLRPTPLAGTPAAVRAPGHETRPSP
jgi:hypothetical protein